LRQRRDPAQRRVLGNSRGTSSPCFTPAP
jgi:hypothetical protein